MRFKFMQFMQTHDLGGASAILYCLNVQCTTDISKLAILSDWNKKNWKGFFIFNVMKSNERNPLFCQQTVQDQQRRPAAIMESALMV